MYKDLTMEIVIDDIKGNQMKLFHQDAYVKIAIYSVRCKQQWSSYMMTLQGI